MIDLIDYERSHGRYLFDENLRDGAEIEAWFDQANFEVWIAGLEQPGKSFTAIDDEHGILACAGIVEKWRGVGEAWMVVGKALEHKPLSGARLAKRHMEQMAERHGYWRVQVNVHVENLPALRFAKWLGFVMEGEMAEYGPDRKNYYRMGRLF